MNDMQEMEETKVAVENENLESNPNKIKVRSCIGEQVFSTSLKEIYGANLCGCYGIFDNEMVIKGEWRGVPVHMDSVEYNPSKFSTAIIYIPEDTCTPIQGDLFDALLNKVVRSYGVGSIRNVQDYHKYNVIFFDFCAHGTPELFEKIATSIKYGTQEESMSYITFQLNGARIEDGYEGAYNLTGEKWEKEEAPTAYDVAEAVIKGLEKKFSEHRILTKLRMVFKVIYRGGARSAMLTIGFSKGLPRMKRVDADWYGESKEYAKKRLSDLYHFKMEVQKKQTITKRISSLKLNKRAKRNEQKEKELQKKIILRNTCKVLKDNGWSNEKIGERLSINPYQVRAFLSQFSGKFVEKRQFKVEKVKVTSAWVQKILKMVA